MEMLVKKWQAFTEMLVKLILKCSLNPRLMKPYIGHKALSHGDVTPAIF
jgi:hypothetical protein